MKPSGSTRSATLTWPFSTMLGVIFAGPQQLPFVTIKGRKSSSRRRLCASCADEMLLPCCFCIGREIGDMKKSSPKLNCTSWLTFIGFVASELSKTMRERL